VYDHEYQVYYREKEYKNPKILKIQSLATLPSVFPLFHGSCECGEEQRQFVWKRKISLSV